ncbi:MAG: hypothetical protein ACF8R7_04630 [Phycisphaerales bacterium JB039]
MNGRMLRLAAGAALAIATLVPVARAQPGGGGPFGGGQMGPSVSTRDLETYAGMLGMDEGQRELAMALFESYRDSIEAEAQKFRDAMEDARAEFQQTQDRSAFEGVREQGEAYQQRRENLEQTFFSDVKSLLTPEQEQAWPKVERAHRRNTTLQRGLMSGERVDLVQIASEVEVGDNPRVTAALGLYEVDLDRVLVRRNQVIEDAFGQVRELFEDGDQDRIERVFDNARDASKQVRDVNRRYADQIAALLDAEKAAAFRAAVQEAALPRVYRPTQASRALDAAMGFEDLTENQKAAVQALKDRYDGQLAPLNAQLAREIEKAEEDADARTFMRMRFQRGGQQGRGGRGGDDDGTRELMDKRRDLDRQTLDLLSETLTEAQIERLPRPEPQRDAGGRQRGGQAARGRDIN